MRWIVSVKAVVMDASARVLLGLNDRDEWELPGGQMEADEQPEQTVVREVAEETGLTVVPERLLRTWVFRPVPGGGSVLIISFACRIVDGALTPSHEHRRIEFHPVDALADLDLPDGYRSDIALAAPQRTRPD